jgi:predicted Zn-dependent protease
LCDLLGDAPLNWSDQSGGRITGMTRYAFFWVENSEFIAPIENLRFDDSIYDFLGEKLEAFTDSRELSMYLHQIL